MFIVRWLMSHPILFAWALAALAIILNWGTKSGVDHAEPKDVAAVHSQQASEAKDAHGDKDANNNAQAATEAPTLSSPEQPVVPVAPVKELQKPEQPEKPGMDAAAATATVSAEVSKPAGLVDATTNANDTADVASTEKVQEKAAVEVASTEINQAGTPVEQESAPVAKATTAPEAPVTEAVGNEATASSSVDSEAKTPDELLNAAREAFWHNEKEEAASIYKQLIEMQPEVLEHKGELGNVYWHQNKQKESAALYADIAIPLIEKGKSAQVENMLGFIGAFYPEKATEIHQYLMNNQ